jgi:hypothetical protein
MRVYMLTEIFCRLQITVELSLILNLECSTKQITEQASLWFSRLKEGISILLI